MTIPEDTSSRRYLSGADVSAEIEALRADGWEVACSARFHEQQRRELEPSTTLYYSELGPVRWARLERGATEHLAGPDLDAAVAIALAKPTATPPPYSTDWVEAHRAARDFRERFGHNPYADPQVVAAKERRTKFPPGISYEDPPGEAELALELCRAIVRLSAEPMGAAELAEAKRGAEQERKAAVTAAIGLDGYGISPSKSTAPTGLASPLGTAHSTMTIVLRAGTGE